MAKLDGARLPMCERYETRRSIAKAVSGAALSGAIAVFVHIPRAVLADQITTCTALQFCYCVDADFSGAIDGHVIQVRKAIREQREQGKAIGYISIPLSTLEGSYFGLNVQIAGDVKTSVEARFGANSAWMLNPGAKDWSLPDNATGADYMLMWTRVLEGSDGLGSDFDFVYFVGPSDFARTLQLTGQGDMERLEAYYDARAATDERLRKVNRRQFRDYYALRASVAFSLGSHDEWNIVRGINERRRLANPTQGIANQLGVFFDGRPVGPGLYETPIATGTVGACRPK